MVALAIDLLRAFGFTEEDFVVRVSDRKAWMAFLGAQGASTNSARGGFLPIIDKIERGRRRTLEAKLAPFGLTLEEVRAVHCQSGGHFEKFNALAAELDARGMKPFYQLDPTIVRGLAYYTGLVFEVFDRKRTQRAIAGGGRYDNLVSAHERWAGRSCRRSDFGMGDVVLSQLIELSPAAARRNGAVRSTREAAADVYVVIAKEERRPEALGLVQQLRERGLRLDFPLAARESRQTISGRRASSAPASPCSSATNGRRLK